MIGIMFIFLVAIFGYYGYMEGMKTWKKYLADRLAQQKEAEEAAMKAMMDQAAKASGAPVQKMSDADFNALLDRLFIPWGRTKGIIR